MPVQIYNNGSGRLLEEVRMLTKNPDFRETPLLDAVQSPDDLKLPLRAARVTWWLIPDGITHVDLHDLDAEPDPGY